MCEPSDPKNRVTVVGGESTSAAPGRREAATTQPAAAQVSDDGLPVRDARQTRRHDASATGEQESTGTGTVHTRNDGPAMGTGGDGATGTAGHRRAEQAMRREDAARGDMPQQAAHGRLAQRDEDSWVRGAVERERPARLAERVGVAGASEPSSRWSDDWLQLSHELRTPLNAILGNIELLLDGSAGPLAAPARACVGDIQVASRQLLKQVQPLLLLVQARTSGAVATRMPLDLLALVRQASADAACAAEAAGEERRDATGPDAAPVPGAARIMIAGDPIWLGALAAALAELHAASAGARGPLSIVREADRCAAAGRRTADAILRAWWDGLDPAEASPLPLALIDAVANLHGGRIVSFCGDGLRLGLPADVVA